MTQWWELAIPAGSAMVAGWSGAWLQGYLSARNLRMQLEDSARARAEAATRERRVRDHEKRLDSYLRMLTMIDERARVLDDYEANQAELARLESEAESLTRDKGKLEENLQKQVELSRGLADQSLRMAGFLEESVRAFRLIQLIGGKDVASRANRLRGSGTPEELTAIAEFVAAARRDLEVTEGELQSLKAPEEG